LTNHSNAERNPKEVKLIEKAEKSVIRKMFENILDLRVSVYNSLIRYLEENEIIRTLPFDATLNTYATWKDLDKEKIKNFLYIAHEKRAFRFTQNANPKMVLTHLNLIKGDRITNAAILLFGKIRNVFSLHPKSDAQCFPIMTFLNLSLPIRFIKVMCLNW
jgi:predicted HTH transcriptional regulator